MTGPAAVHPGAGEAAKPILGEERRLVPVKWWAGIGALLVAFIVYLLVAWIASGDASRTPSGPDPVPEWMHITGIAAQVVSVAVALILIHRLVVRPLRRDGTVPFDGLLLLGLGSIYWQDPIVNYMQAWSAFNSDLVNLGSWANHIPGWRSPNAEHFAEPFLFAGFGYMWVLYGGILGANWAMRKAKARWPRTGKFGLVMVCYGFLAGFDLLMELTFMRLGLWTYGGSIPSLTVFHGHYYQFPIYEAALWGGVWAVWACLRYFRDDRGHSMAERGVDMLRLGRRARNWVRGLAVVGVLNVSLLFVFNLPFQLFAVHSGPWVEDAQSRSYLMDRLCGPHTDVACAGPDVPIHTRGGAHLDPDGRLVRSPHDRWTK